MIDDLLQRFGHLGVRAAVPRATPAAPAPTLLTTQQLKERGWSATMIAKLLPRHDSTRANQLEVGRTRKPLTAPVKLYALARVEEAETTEDFLITQAQAAKGRKAAGKAATTRAERVAAYLDGYVPQLANPPTPLFGHALWKHHLDELTQYEHVHTETWLKFSSTDRKRTSNELYTKHRSAFIAKFGDEY